MPSTSKQLERQTKKMPLKHSGLPGFTNAGRWDGILLKLNLSDGQIVATNQWGNAGIDGYGCTHRLN
jgi:hypothetical protein